MIKVSMRLDYVLPEYTLEDQFKISSEVGVDGVEIGELSECNCMRAAELSAKYNVPVIACGYYNMWPTRLGIPFIEIKDNFDKTITCAKELGCRTLLSLSGNSVNRDETSRLMFVENMKPVVERCEKEDITVVLEPHNTKYINPVFDFSEYYMDTTLIGYDLIGRIKSDHVKLLFDCYHVQTMEGDLLMNIKKNLSMIGHFHIAGVPDRDEPWNGEVSYQNIVQKINDMGYKGYYGLEYYPENTKKIDVLAAAITYIKNS